MLIEIKFKIKQNYVCSECGAIRLGDQITKTFISVESFNDLIESNKIVTKE